MNKRISATFEFDGKNEFTIQADYDKDMASYRKLQYLVKYLTGLEVGCN